MDNITKEQRIKAIEDSIKHWQEDDIVKPLQAGRVIYRITLTWNDDREYVNCDYKHCPLCMLFYDDTTYDCGDCPLVSCGQESTWMAFSLKPCLKTAQAMVYELRAVLIMEDMKHD